MPTIDEVLFPTGLIATPSQFQKGNNATRDRFRQVGVAHFQVGSPHRIVERPPNARAWHQPRGDPVIMKRHQADRDQCVGIVLTRRVDQPERGHTPGDEFPVVIFQGVIHTAKLRDDLPSRSKCDRS